MTRRRRGTIRKNRREVEENERKKVRGISFSLLGLISSSSHACYSSSPMELEKISAAQSSMLKALDIDPAVNENAVAKFSSSKKTNYKKITKNFVSCRFSSYFTLFFFHFFFSFFLGRNDFG